MHSKKVLVPIANGTEELEAVTIIDVLRRAELAVRVASVETKEITGAHHIKIVADSLFEDETIDDYDAIILPGGTNGAKFFASYQPLIKALSHFIKQKNLVAAICASPALVLAQNGLLKDSSATCYPELKHMLTNYVDEKVVIANNIITSQGPATALEFSFALIEELANKNIAQKIKGDMCYS